MIAAGAGRYWAVAELREPSLDNPFGSGDIVGFGVLRFDESGQLLHSAPANVSSTLQAPIPMAYTRSVQVDANGALLWATVSSDRKGIELRRVRADGEPSSEQLAVAEGGPGHAMWTADGSVVLGYRYLTELLTSDPAVPKLLPGIARFDASGHLLYNQTLLSASVEVEPNVITAVVKVGGIGTSGEATFRVAEVRQSGMFGETRLLRLDGNGNVVWASELPNAYASSFNSDADMQVYPDGTSLIVHRSAPCRPQTKEPARH
jgi:hypothetical protein